MQQYLGLINLNAHAIHNHRRLTSANRDGALLCLQTCLYGLAITLRCAIGMKSSTLESSSDLSEEMESLLRGMLNKDLDKRPPLTEVLAVSTCINCFVLPFFFFDVGRVL